MLNINYLSENIVVSNGVQVSTFSMLQTLTVCLWSHHIDSDFQIHGTEWHIL